MTFKEKYNSIDQSKLPETAKAYMAEFKKDSDNFTNKQAMTLMMPVLDRFIKGLKDSGYGDAVKGGAKKETKKAETPKEMAKEIVEEAVEQPETKTGKPKVGKISKGDFMKIAKEIRKEGESWNDAMKRAGDIIRTQKEVVKKEATRQYEKLKKFIEKHPEVYPMDIPVQGGGFRKTTVNRDAPRVALAKGKRVSKAGWKNQYGKSDGGKTYYEYRSNRYDTRRQRYPFLAKGGEVDAIFAKGGEASEWKIGDKFRVLKGIYGDYNSPRYANKEFEVINIRDGKYIDARTPKGTTETFEAKNIEKIKYAKGGEIKIGDNVHIIGQNKSGFVTNVISNGKHFTVKFVDGTKNVYDKHEIEKILDEGDYDEYAKGGELGKNYYTMQNVGRSKYVINSYDGVKTHKDGSPFYDIDIYKNKVDFQKAIKRLEAEGYVSRYAKGGYTATGEDYEYVNTFGITQPDFEEIVEAWHKGNSLRNTDRINSRLVFRKMENKYGEDKIEEISEYIMKTHEGHEHYAKGGEMGKLDAGVYRVGKPKKVSPYSYAQKIVEIFENGDISTASDYARKAADFHSLKQYPVISEEQLEAQYKYAKGGEISDVRIGDILITSTGVKVVVVDYDSMFGGRVKAVRLDEYATGKPSQWMPVTNFKKYAKGGKTDDIDYSKQTTDDFTLGEIVWDVENRTYGTIIGIYDDYPSSKYELRLDSDGMQPTENLRKLGSKGDNGSKEQLNEAITQYARLVKNYGKDNNYPKQIKPEDAKGGGISKSTTYVPNRDVKELMVVLKGELTKLKGKDILDGVYVKNNRKPASNKNAAKELLALFKKEAEKDPYGAEVGIDISDIEKLFGAGLSEQDVKNIFLGYSPSSVKADTEFGSTTSGLIGYTGESQKDKIDEIVTTIKDGYYEIGLKYPEGFDWKAIISKYKISRTPKIIETESPMGENRFEIYIGDGVVVGHRSSYKFKEDSKWSEDFLYGELDSKNPKFETGYWGIVTKKKEDMYYIVDTLLKQSKGYVKDVVLFNNSLGGISADDVMNEKFAMGGVVDMYKIVEGYDHYNDKPLYTVESTGDNPNEYVGEYHDNIEDAREELNNLIAAHKSKNKFAKGGRVEVVLNEGNGKVLNDIYNMWNNVKTEQQYKKWVEKVRNTKFGTYGTLSFEEVMEKFDFDNAPINSFHLKTFKQELKNALSNTKYAKGGEIKVTTGVFGENESWRITHPKVDGIGIYPKKRFTEEEAKDDFSKRYLSKNNSAKGGKIGFKGLSEKVAKYYANKSVPSKYQTLYGKKYDKAEAKEVGDKVAAKVYRQQQSKKK